MTINDLGLSIVRFSILRLRAAPAGQASSAVVEVVGRWLPLGDHVACIVVHPSEAKVSTGTCQSIASKLSGQATGSHHSALALCGTAEVPPEALLGNGQEVTYLLRLAIAISVHAWHALHGLGHRVEACMISKLRLLLLTRVINLDQTVHLICKPSIF